MLQISCSGQDALVVRFATQVSCHMLQSAINTTVVADNILNYCSAEDMSTAGHAYLQATSSNPRFLSSASRGCGSLWLLRAGAGGLLISGMMTGIKLPSNF